MEVLLGKIDGLMRNHDTYFNLILMGEYVFQYSSCENTCAFSGHYPMYFLNSLHVVQLIIMLMSERFHMKKDLIISFHHTFLM